MNEELIEQFLLQRYPDDSYQKAVRDEITFACVDFIQSGLADSNFTNELCSNDEQKYWGRVSEALLAARLKQVGITPEPSRNSGPDFLLINKGQKIWVEVICPEPKGIPLEWLDPEQVNARKYPHEQILLRWTSAIKEKSEKLLGNEDGAVKGYINKGIVESTDAYVNAVNGCQLRRGFNGISQLPCVVEAVFAVGPYQLKIDRDSLKQIGAGYQHRPLIVKPKGEPVPAYTFLDSKFRPISAIWAVDVNGTAVVGNLEPMVVVHNPNAVNPIPIGLLPAHDEYIAKTIGLEEYKLNRIEGSLRSRT
jgi:type I restriction enzyme S subunit